MPVQDRDFDRNPYSDDEARVARFLSDAGAGGGDDPVGFILASHAELARQRNLLRDRLRDAGLPIDVDDDIPVSEPGPA